MNETTDLQIVQIDEDGEPRVSTESIAAGYGLQHKNVLALLKRFLSHMMTLGVVAFETRLNHQGSPTEFPAQRPQRSFPHPGLRPGLAGSAVVG